MIDRNAVLAHAEQYWFRPCEDGDVWLNSAPINVKNKLNELRLSPAEWDFVFLQDNSWSDHLFAVRRHYVPNLLLTQVATFNRLENEVEATRNDKQRDLQLEAGGSDGMNMLGEETLNETAGGFHRFAGGGHQVMHRRVQAPLGVVFT